LLISKLTLAQLMQLKISRILTPEDRDYPTDNTGVLFKTALEIYNKAREQRTEIKIAKQNVSVAEKDVKIAKGLISLPCRVFIVLQPVPLIQTGWLAISKALRHQIILSVL
jgi:outer membrane protein